ncbi:MAG TPA: hypothetical protein VFL57_01325 [Bryobacteraceae bacterium]|nr:hypothetical protein [Bryobacteraceae bacterium]
MPIEYTESAAETRATYDATVAALVHKDALAGKTIHLQVETLGLKELANGADLSAAKPSGCRFFTVQPDGSVVAADVADPGEYADTAKLRSLMRSNLAAETYERIVSADRLEALAAERYEARLLSIPGIFVEALRVRSTDGGVEFVVPLVASEPALNAQPVFKPDDFLAIARSLAAERLEAWREIQNEPDGSA